MKDIKIFVSYKNKNKLTNSEIIQPIQTGRSISNEIFEDMIGDDTGENISAENDKYCELTAQYWAWKNYDKLGNPDYIGFMHYRRHFMFDGWQGDSQNVWLPNGNVYFVPFISNKYLQHISDKNINKQLVDCDCITIKPYDLPYIGSRSCREQYGKLVRQGVSNFDIFIKTAKEIAPNYIPEIEMIEHGSLQYLCNMFVMNKDLFFEYSKFCFDVLFATEKRIKVDLSDKDAARALGYFGEFLLSVFIFKLKKNKNIRIRELNASFILSDKIIKYPKIPYLYYKFMSKFVWGAKRKKYQERKKEYKNIYKTIKNLENINQRC